MNEPVNPAGSIQDGLVYVSPHAFAGADHVCIRVLLDRPVVDVTQHQTVLGYTSKLRTRAR
jgi:hypothetical protein